MHDNYYWTLARGSRNLNVISLGELDMWHNPPPPSGQAKEIGELNIVDFNKFKTPALVHGSFRTHVSLMYAYARMNIALI